MQVHINLSKIILYSKIAGVKRVSSGLGEGLRLRESLELKDDLDIRRIVKDFSWRMGGIVVEWRQRGKLKYNRRWSGE